MPSLATARAEGGHSRRGAHRPGFDDGGEVLRRRGDCNHRYLGREAKGSSRGERLVAR